jgi:hypothetical protein
MFLSLDGRGSGAGQMDKAKAGEVEEMKKTFPRCLLQTEIEGLLLSGRGSQGRSRSVRVEDGSEAVECVCG